MKTFLSVLFYKWSESKFGVETTDNLLEIIAKFLAIFASISFVVIFVYIILRHLYDRKKLKKLKQEDFVKFYDDNQT